MKKSTKILLVFLGAYLLIHICAVICISTMSLGKDIMTDGSDTIVQYKYIFKGEMSDEELDSIVGDIEDKLDMNE